MCTCTLFFLSIPFSERHTSSPLHKTGEERGRCAVRNCISPGDITAVWDWIVGSWCCWVSLSDGAVGLSSTFWVLAPKARSLPVSLCIGSQWVSFLFFDLPSCCVGALYFYALLHPDAAPICCRNIRRTFYSCPILFVLSAPGPQIIPIHHKLQKKTTQKRKDKKPSIRFVCPSWPMLLHVRLHVHVDTALQVSTFIFFFSFFLICFLARIF